MKFLIVVNRTVLFCKCWYCKYSARWQVHKRLREFWRFTCYTVIPREQEGQSSSYILPCSPPHLFHERSELSSAKEFVFRNSPLKLLSSLRRHLNDVSFVFPKFLHWRWSPSRNWMLLNTSLLTNRISVQQTYINKYMKIKYARCNLWKIFWIVSWVQNVVIERFHTPRIFRMSISLNK